MARLSKTYAENEFGIAADYARYLAKRENKELCIYHYAYGLKGGFYVITDTVYEPADCETLIATMHKLPEADASL